MKNLTFFLFALLLGLSQYTYGATNDFVANGDISVPSVVQDSVTANMTILNGSGAESWQYDSGNLTVTNPDSINRFKITSDSGTAIRATLNGADVACVNNAERGTTFITLPYTTGTYKVYAFNGSCPSTSGSSGYAGYAGSSNSNTTMNNSVTTSSIKSSTFTKDLKIGMKDVEVKILQHYLNTHGFVVVTSGPGSLDNETNLFGPATKSALIKFQKANKISPAVGFFGKITRTFVNSH